jgi:hypothetical protein
VRPLVTGIISSMIVFARVHRALNRDVNIVVLRLKMNCLIDIFVLRTRLIVRVLSWKRDSIIGMGMFCVM